MPEKTIKPKVLLFDIGGVVINWDPQITYDYLKTLGIPEERAKLFFDDEAYNDFSRGKLTEQDFYEELKIILRAPDLSYEQAVYAHSISMPGLVDGIKDLIQQLSENHKLAFVTDTEPWQDKHLESLIDLNQYPIFKSHEIGSLKAEGEFFLYVIRELGIEPKEALLIDDSSNKIEMAHQSGIETVLFSNVSELNADLERRSLLETESVSPRERK